MTVRFILTCGGVNTMAQIIPGNKQILKIKAKE